MPLSGITSGVTATPPTLTGVYVGTSGFSYASWKPDFYPPDAKPRDFLRRYAERLLTVELNATFYRLPSEEQLVAWAEQTPPGFRFAVKMNRRITHHGRLELIPTFCERVRTLGDRLGPILVQLPPSRPRDDGLLRLYMDSLDPELAWSREVIAAEVRRVKLTAATRMPAPRVSARAERNRSWLARNLTKETNPSIQA